MNLVHSGWFWIKSDLNTVFVSWVSKATFSITALLMHWCHLIQSLASLRTFFKLAFFNHTHPTFHTSSNMNSLYPSFTDVTASSLRASYFGDLSGSSSHTRLPSSLRRWRTTAFASAYTYDSTVKLTVSCLPYRSWKVRQRMVMCLTLMH